MNRLVTSILLFSLTFWSSATPIIEDYHNGRDTAQPQQPLFLGSPQEPTKSIAVIGAGSAGLAALKTLLDLPEETRKGWKIVLYEQRRDVGGVW